MRSMRFLASRERLFLSQAESIEGNAVRFTSANGNVDVSGRVLRGHTSYPAGSGD